MDGRGGGCDVGALNFTPCTCLLRYPPSPPPTPHTPTHRDV